MSEQLSDLRNEIAIEANAGDGSFKIDAFARVFSQALEDAEVVADINIEYLRCNGPRGRRLELLGYAEEPIDQSLVLLTGRYFGGDSTLTMTDAKELARRATGFIELSADGWLVSNLEMSSPEWGLAKYLSQQIADQRYAKIRVVVITDALMSSRIRTIESDVIAGLKTTYEIWDQQRIVDAAIPERGSEDISVDFTRWMPEGLPCLLASSADGTTQTYLAVIPGNVLAEVFDEYGSLLLESNVRTYLSARGLVNKGIQATLAQEPQRFLAYNNGLTTTATGIELGSSSSGTTINRLDRWQIVNGGQTTASLAHFLRSDKSRTVDNVAIQMKLVLVKNEDATSMVQAVAKYANSQNRVSAADLFSTHEFHVRMEQISRRVKAPAKESQQYQTYWFYERARGQWENDRAASTSPSRRARFEMTYPKSQRITKTDWAKYEYCWEQRPDIVSKGAQTAFADFATKVDRQWRKADGKGADAYGDSYFREGVAKAIMYNELRAEVLKQKWYKDSKGYLANIVAYAISKFSLQIQKQFKGSELDFGIVWRNQRISKTTLESLLLLAHASQIHLTSDDRPQANVTQWAKQPACWERFKDIEILLDPALRDDFQSAVDAENNATYARKQRSMDTGIEAVQRVLKVSASVWESVDSATSGVGTSPMENDLLRLFGFNSGKVPSPRQATALIRLLNRMADNGVIARNSY